MDLSDDLGYPGVWHLIEVETGSWSLEHDGVYLGSVRRSATDGGRRGWRARLADGIEVPAAGSLAVNAASSLWRSRDLAAAGLAHRLGHRP